MAWRDQSLKQYNLILPLTVALQFKTFAADRNMYAADAPADPSEFARSTRGPTLLLSSALASCVRWGHRPGRLPRLLEAPTGNKHAQFQATNGHFGMAKGL